MPNPVLEVTMTGEPVCRSVDGTRLLTAEEFGALLERVADCVHDEVDDACVSGRADTGKVEVWFLVLDAQTFHSGLRQAAEIIEKITQAAEQETIRATSAPDPAAKGTPSPAGFVMLSQMRQQCKELVGTLPVSA